MRRMLSASPAADFASAKKLLDDTLNAVEDEMTDIPYNPALWESDGRMYPVQDDNVRTVAGRPDLRRLASVAHDTLIRDNGAIEIRVRRTKQVLFRKAGADGKEVSDD